MTSSRETVRRLPAERAFVVQFSAETNVELGCFEGRVEHVVSGHARRFATLDELVASLVEMLLRLDATTPEAGENAGGGTDAPLV